MMLSVTNRTSDVYGGMTMMEAMKKMADGKNVRFAVAGQLLKDWEAMLEKKRISQQSAIESLMRFVVAQDDLAQSMILGQIAPAPDLVAAVLKRMERAHDMGERKEPKLATSRDQQPGSPANGSGRSGKRQSSNRARESTETPADPAK